MKRTELQRKTPLKKTAFKKKRKKKTALQKRIDKMDSPYWDKKNDEAQKAYAHTQPCFVCGLYEWELGDHKYIVGHHLIPRRKSRYFRWHPDNLIPLCPKHHYNHKGPLAAHSEDGMSVQAFNDLLKARLPQVYANWKMREEYLIQQNLCDGPKDRPDWRYQSTIWKQRAADALILQEKTDADD